MIRYSGTLAKDAVNEVIVRLGYFRLNVSPDFTEILRHLNRAIKETAAETLPFKRWAYIDKVNISNGTVLPRAYFDAARALLSETGDPPYREARKVDAKEFFEIVVDWRRNQWTRSAKNNPVITVWGTSSTTPKLAVYIEPDNFSGILEYYAIPDDLTDPDDLIKLPYEYVNLAIIKTIERLLAKARSREALTRVKADIEEARAKIDALFIEKRKAEKRDLDSFVEPVIPLAPPAQPAGELKKELR